MSIQFVNTLSVSFPAHAPFRILAAGAVQGMSGDSFVKENYPYRLMECVISGKGYLTIDGQTHELTRGDCYWVKPGSDCDYRSDLKEPWFKQFFIADGELIDPLLTAYRMKRIAVITDADVFDAFERMMVLSNHDAPDIHEKAGLLFHELLLQLKLGSKPIHDEVPETILTVKNYLDGRLEKHVSMDDLAEKVHLSKGHLIRNFRKHVGMTPYEYLLSRRIEKAKVLLRNTSMTVGAVAGRLSFDDQYYFSNFFKKRTGVSPSHYRTEGRAEGDDVLHV